MRQLLKGTIRRKNWQRLKSKSLAIIVAALLVSSASGFLAFKEIVNAHSPAWNIATQTYLSVEPNPISVGETAFINFGLTQPTPTTDGIYGDRWLNLTIRVVTPDGTAQILGPFAAGNSGGTYTEYAPSQAGDYSFQAFFGGQVLAGANLAPGTNSSSYPNIGDYYMPSASSITTLEVQAQQIGTPVNGTIVSDTVWTQENGPYILTGNVVVNGGVTLSIEPGTVVNFYDYFILVNGALQAVGDAANPIIFNGGAVAFTPSSEGWNETAGSGSIIANSLIDSFLTLNSSARIICNFIYDGIQVNAPATITNNTVSEGVTVDGDATLSYNMISGQGVTVYSNATVSYNQIYDCLTGIEATTILNGVTGEWFNPQIWGNLILSCSNGLEILANGDAHPGSTTIMNNTITGNTNGIYVASNSGQPTPTIEFNNICGNDYNMKLSVSNDVNAEFNWWGTTSTQAINQTIYDSKFDASLGQVSFVPFLTQPNAQAPPVSNPTPTPAPSPTPSPIPTPTPSQSPTPVSTPNPTPTTSPSPSPTPSPKNPSNIDFSCIGSASFSILNVDITGNLTSGSGGIANSEVFFSYSVNAGKSWIDLTTVDTDSNGNFLVLWHPQVTGTYLLKAVYDGNSIYANATKIVTFALAPVIQEQDVFSVMSNSTITALYFNSTSNQLSFTTNGTSGTTGFVNVCLPKSLVNNAADLKIYLDGSPVTYTVTSQINDWLVSFTYNQSSHRVTIDLGSQVVATATRGNQTETLVIISTVLAVIIVAAALITRKKTGKHRHPSKT